MPKSSRHKSSRHTREYSDSEREYALKDRKGREDGGGSRDGHLKDSTSGEKRKLDSKSIYVSKESVGLGDAELIDRYGGGSDVVSLSKRRKEKVEDDRWTGGDFKDEHELLKREMKREKEVGRGSGESRRSSRREEGGFDVNEGKKSGSKVESKHHRSERKERSEKEGGSERERKGSRSDRSERLVDIVSVSENAGSEGNKKQGESADERVEKHGSSNTDCNMKEERRNLEPVRDSDRRVRRKMDGSGDGDKHLGGVRDLEDRRLSRIDENDKYGKNKDDRQQDESYQGRFQLDVDKDNWHRDVKQLDNQSTEDYNGRRSDDKHFRNEKKDSDTSQKKMKPHFSEYDRELEVDIKERDRDRDCDRDGVRDRGCDLSRHDHYSDRELDDQEYEVDRDCEQVLELSHNRDRKDRELDRYRGHSRDRYRRDRDRDQVHDRDTDGGRDNHDYASHVDEKGSRHKDYRGRRRSPDVYDGYHGDKVRRVHSEVDRGRSLSHKRNVDGVASSGHRRASPSRAYVVADKFRDGIQDEAKCTDLVRDSTMSEAGDKVPKYRSGEKRSKYDENHIGEFSERSSNTKLSPAGLKERSPSASCFDRSRSKGKSSRRRSLEVDGAERRSSVSNEFRDISAAEDRQSREFSAKKFMGDEYPSSDPSMYHKPDQGNVSSHGGPSPSGPSVYRTGADSPSFIRSFGEDSRSHLGSRYRRSVDSNVGRGPDNAWNGVPNWPTPLSNGFMPFPPGPPGPHHGFPLLSQFPPLFGVRPLDTNHPGMPYHMVDGDRFPGHVRPIGWPNMVDGSVPPHFHGYDGGHGILRDEPAMFGLGHLGNAQRRVMNVDVWQQNGDMKADITSGSQKEGQTIKASADEVSSAHGGSRHNVENSGLDDPVTSLKKDTLGVLSPMKETSMTVAKVTTEKTPDSSSVDDTAHSLRAYLDKLDISIDLADRDLYNQFTDLAVKELSLNIEEEKELEHTEEKAVVIPEFTNVTMDVNLFPAAQDSIFQRAMDLYKEHSNESSSFGELKGRKFCASPAQPKVERTTLLDDKVEDSVGGVKQEMQMSAGPEEMVPFTREKDVKEPICTGVEILNDGPLQSSELAPDVGDEGELPVFELEKMEEDAPERLTSETDDIATLPLESIVSDTAGSIVDKDIVTDGDTTHSYNSSPEEQMDVAVSSPIILPHDSVKVCEPLISVSKEESVILSRIHHAPESTH